MTDGEDETALETRTTGERGKDVVLMLRAPDRTDAIRLVEGHSIVIGRGADAGLVIDHAKVSRSHATIRLRAGVLLVEDLGGRNGTRVNDRVLRGESAVLRSGDRVLIGDAEIVASVPERRDDPGDFLEGELAQMLAAKGSDVALVRVAFAEQPPDEILDAFDREVGERGLVVQESDAEVYALVHGPDADAIIASAAAIAPGGRTSVARHPADGRTAAALVRAAEQAAGRGLANQPDVIVADAAMLKVYETVRRIAAVPTTVLLLGETGSGKELVAEAIHHASPRRSGPFVRLNCGALPENLLESELFGHEKGAFTGADRMKIGLFEAANQGTIFLDEIGEMTLSAQVRLLRVLETKRLTRLGSVAETPIDARVVCATHRDLPVLVERGAFRQDLYYRIATTTVRVPPLRERPLEIPLLARAFARAAAERSNLAAPALSEDVLRVLSRHSFPGNVRELKNAMEHAVVMAGGGSIGTEHLPESMAPRGPGGAVATPLASVKHHVAEAEKKAVLEALKKTGGNRTHAAALLGVSRRTLVYKLARYGIGKD